MRAVSPLLGLSLALIGTAVGTTRQTDALAENQFKNIQSFKGSKASDLLPAMQFMDGSLNVECGYCHVADRSSDEKQEKKTAREMIAMQREINERNFRGRNVVTCATCHAGHTHPVAVPPVAGVADRTRRSNDVSADAVLAAYAKAVGTPSADPVSAIKISGKVTARGETAPFEATYSGDKFIIITHSKGGEQKSGFDGASVWFTTPKGVQRVPAEFGTQFRRESAIFTSPDGLPKLTNPTGGTAKIDGKDSLVVSGVIGEEKGRTQLFFDKTSGLLVRTSYSYPTILGNIVQINDYSHYVKFGGLQVPAIIATHSTEGDSLKEIRSFHYAKVDPAIFDPGK